jgi:parallel beta-helix repeat protein
MLSFQRLQMIASGLLAGVLAACGGGGDSAPEAAVSSTSASALGAARAVVVADPVVATPVAPVVAAVAPAASSPVQNLLGEAVGASSPPASSDSVAAAAVAAQAGSRSVNGVTYARVVYVDGASASADDNGPGSQAQPYRTISAAMSHLRPGDDVVVAPGVYREAVVVPALGWNSLKTRLRAQSPRTALIKGSNEVAGWNAGAVAGTYWVLWSGEEPQQVYRQGVALKQIGGNVFGGYPGLPGNNMADVHSADGGIWPGRIAGGVDQLVADSFTFDASTRRLYVKVSQPITTGQVLEVSARRHVFQAESAAGFSVEGLDFAHSNTSVIYRWGAVKMVGQNNVLNDLVISDMDASCVQIAGTDITLSNSTIQRCGQIGINGFGTRLTIANNKVTEANTRGFNKWWEAGGMKLIGDGGLHNSTIRGNVVAYNYGDGIWVDWMNSDNLVEGNTTAYNTGFGIQYEASQSGTFLRNTSYGNGMRGIYLVESSSSNVEANVVFANVMEGIGVVDGTRSAAYPALKPRNNRIANNFIAWNDFNRNWVQLVIPALDMGTVSVANIFKAELLLPRMSVGFMGVNNPAFVDLVAWQAALGLDVGSTEQKVAMPASLQALIAARTLLTAADIAQYQLTVAK